MLCCINSTKKLGIATKVTAIGISRANFGQTRGFGCHFEFLAGKRPLRYLTCVLLHLLTLKT